MRGAIPPLPHTHSWRGAQLKNRDNFTFTLPFNGIHWIQHLYTCAGVYKTRNLINWALDRSCVFCLGMLIFSAINLSIYVGPNSHTHEGLYISFRTESITKYTLTFGISRWEATQRVMAGKLTRLTHKIAIQLHLVTESCTICSSRSRWPVRKLLDTHSLVGQLTLGMPWLNIWLHEKCHLYGEKLYILHCFLFLL
jgi:hypothetical protein